jgi:hypothetical protein
MWRGALVALILTSGCRKKAPEAPPEFSDALVHLFTSFDEDDEVLSQAVRDIEAQIYLGMDVTAENFTDRALEPDGLTTDNVQALERDPDRSVADALPVAVAFASAFSLEDHSPLQLLVDHRPFEPYSPDHFERFFLEGEECWGDRSCTLLRTHNELTKKNALMEVIYEFYKDFRWLDISTEGPARWAYVGRSWNPRSFEGEGSSAWIHQSYTIELWVPRDGRGFIRDGSSQNVDDGTWAADSSGDGTLRMLSLWSETEFKGFSFSDDAVIGTMRLGIDKNFNATDDHLAGLTE